MKKVCVLSAVLMSLAFVGISDVSAAPNWLQMQKQNASTAIVKRQYDSLKNDIAKQEQELAVKKAKLVELEKKLGAAQTAQSEMKQQRTDAAAAKAQAKEDNRVAAVNQKSNAAVQKAQLKARQAQYEGKVDIALPGVKNIIKRKQEKAKFTKRANDLIKAGTDFETLSATLRSEFGLN